MNGTEIQGYLERIMSEYLDARATGRVSSQHPINSVFSGLKKALESNPKVAKYREVITKPSVGKGIWATIPWVALLDSRETSTVQEGVYCVFLFRDDMSGVYLTFNQGVTEPKQRLKRAAARNEVRRRAKELRAHCRELTQNGFRLDNDINLHTENPLGVDYEYSTIAYKLYEKGNVPPDEEISDDIDKVLRVYSNYVERKVEGSLRSPEKTKHLVKEMEEPVVGPKISPVRKERVLDVQALVDAILNQGFVFEPWQIATYVTALRTKPFIILAGVSGTGKSKLPSLVADITGGNSNLISVRPDWTDSSDILGYVDLQGVFRTGLLLDIARKASENLDQHFVCIIDEMNLARVEYYFAEVLSRMEDRRPSINGGYESMPLLAQKLKEEDSLWANQCLPPNLAIVGTVNMDESSHSFSRKVLDRAFTIELSDISLDVIPQASSNDEIDLRWPVNTWYPMAIQVGELLGVIGDGKGVIDTVIDILITLNDILSQAQLQVGYRTRDEISLFVIHAKDCADAFVTREGVAVDPLDLALHMKVLPRIVGGSSAIRQTVLKLLYWAYDGEIRPSEDDALQILELWESDDRPGEIEGANYPRTAARLCLMWDRILNDGFTSFWL